jgi:diaminopimelate decarboxylase
MIKVYADLQIGISDSVLSNLKQYMRLGNDPVYIYDSEKIRYRCREFMNIPYEPKSIHFATMANIHPKFLSIIQSEGLHAFVNSTEHLERVHRAGFEGEDIIFTASALTESTMRKIANHDAILFLDSPNQLNQWKDLYPERPVGIRCNLGTFVSAKNTHVGYFIGSKSRLGFTPEEIHAIAGSPIVNGLHLYPGTDIMDVQYFIDCYEAMWRFAELFPNITYMDFGGGFGLDKSAKIHFDVQTYGEWISKMMKEHSQDLGRDFHLLLEPGRIIGGEAGYFACKVTDVKIREKFQFVGVNASSTQFPRPLFYPDSAEHPVTVLRNGMSFNGSEILSSIYGCSTYSRDFLARDIKLPKVEIGDWIFFGNAGSYSAAAHTSFLGFQPAQELFV